MLDLIEKIRKDYSKIQEESALRNSAKLVENIRANSL